MNTADAREHRVYWTCSEWAPVFYPTFSDPADSSFLPLITLHALSLLDHFETTAIVLILLPVISFFAIISFLHAHAELRYNV